jgi:hypothetical protein
VISEPGLAGLQVAATLTHCLPALRLRLRTPGGRALLDVGAGPGPSSTVPTDPDPSASGLSASGLSASGPSASGLSMSPCAFRQQVIRARQRFERGERLGFLSLDGDPEIEIDVPRGGHTFAGGIHRVPIGERWIYAFGVTGAHDVDVRAGRPVVDAWLGTAPDQPDQLGLRPDAELGTVVCYAETEPGFSGEDEIVDLLGGLLAVFTAESVCGSLTAARH